MGEIKVEKSKLLIVEGLDEKYIFEHWFDSLNITDVQILPIGGKTKLKESLELLTRDPNFSDVNKIAIIRDADKNSNSAFSSVCSNLKSNDLDSPTTENVFTTGNPQIKVLIAKGDNNKGSIENYFLKSIEKENTFKCIENYFECIKSIKGEFANSEKLDIAKVYVHLAEVPENARLRLGESVKCGIWDLDGKEFEELKNFITSW